MLAIGSACLIAYPIYEWKFAKFPSMPKRILLNRSFITAVVINFVYMLAAYLQLLYLSSYVYIVTDIDVTHWNCGFSTAQSETCYAFSRSRGRVRPRADILLRRLQQRTEHGSLWSRHHCWLPFQGDWKVQALANLRSLHPNHRLRAYLSFTFTLDSFLTLVIYRRDSSLTRTVSTTMVASSCRSFLLEPVRRSPPSAAKSPRKHQSLIRILVSSSRFFSCGLLSALLWVSAIPALPSLPNCSPLPRSWR